MELWVYENWTHEKAVIHKGDCSYCKHGNGLHGTSGNGNDKWHGPFSSLEDAQKMAEKTGRKVKKSCGICSP